MKIFALILVFGLLLASTFFYVKAQDSDDCVFTCNDDPLPVYEGCTVIRGKIDPVNKISIPKGRCVNQDGNLIPNAPTTSSRDGTTSSRDGTASSNEHPENKEQKCDSIRNNLAVSQNQLSNISNQFDAAMNSYLEKGNQMRPLLKRLASLDSNAFNRLNKQDSYILEAFKTGSSKVDILIEGIATLDQDRADLWEKIESLQVEYIKLDDKVINLKVDLAECEQESQTISGQNSDKSKSKKIGQLMVDDNEYGITVYYGERTAKKSAHDKVSLKPNSMKAHPGNPNPVNFLDVVESVNQIIMERGVEYAKKYLEDVDDKFRDEKGNYKTNSDAPSFYNLKNIFFKSLIADVSEAKKSIDNGLGLDEVLDNFREKGKFYRGNEVEIRNNVEAEIRNYYSSVIGEPDQAYNDRAADLLAEIIYIDTLIGPIPIDTEKIFS